jgi:hypothetical protein
VTHGPKKGVLKSTFGLASNVTFVYSVLGTLAGLDSWQKLREFGVGLSTKFASILSFLDRIIEPLLVPWKLIKTVVFGAMPFDVPPDWQDPLMLSVFTAVLPLGLVLTEGFFQLERKAPAALGASATTLLDELGRLESVAAMDKGRARQELADAVLPRNAPELVVGLQWLMLYGPWVELFRTLGVAQAPDDLVQARFAEARVRVKGAYSDAPTALSAERSKRRSMRRLSMRAILGVVILAGSALDKGLDGGAHFAFGVLWRSFVAVLVMGGVTLLIGLLLIFLSLVKTTAFFGPIDRAVNALLAWVGSSVRTSHLAFRIGKRFGILYVYPDSTWDALADGSVFVSDGFVGVQHSAYFPYSVVEQVVLAASRESLARRLVSRLSRARSPQLETLELQIGIDDGRRIVLSVSTEILLEMPLKTHARLQRIRGTEIIDFSDCPFTIDRTVLSSTASR